MELTWDPEASAGWPPSVSCVLHHETPISEAHRAQPGQGEFRQSLEGSPSSQQRVMSGEGVSLVGTLHMLSKKRSEAYASCAVDPRKSPPCPATRPLPKHACFCWAALPPTPHPGCFSGDW